MRMCVLATAAATRYGNGSTSMAPGALLSGARGPWTATVRHRVSLRHGLRDPRAWEVGASHSDCQSLSMVCVSQLSGRVCGFRFGPNNPGYEACCFKPGNKQLSNKMCLCTTCEEPAQLSSPALAELATVRSTHDGGPTGAALGRLASRFGRGAGHGAWAAPSR